jgi:hypothetical protein
MAFCDSSKIALSAHPKKNYFCNRSNHQKIYRRKNQRHVHNFITLPQRPRLPPIPSLDNPGKL